MLKRIMSAAACLVMVAVMLALGDGEARDPGFAIGVGVAEKRKTRFTIGIGVAEKRNTRCVIGVGVVTNLADYVRVRQGPSTATEIVAVLRSGQEVTILAEEDGFYQIAARIRDEGAESIEIVKGYIRMDFIVWK